MTPRRLRPRLDAHVIADPERLWTAIDEVICTTLGNGKRRRQIVQLQQRLNDAANANVWQLYLEIEEATNSRFELVLVEVVKWAYTEGRRRSRGR